MMKASLASGAIALSLVACAGRDVERRIEGGGSAATTPTTTVQSQDAIARATALLAESRFDDAATLLEASVAAEPGNGQAWLLLAQARHRAGRFEPALVACERAEAIPAARGGALRERFLIRISQGELDAALDAYRMLRAVPMLDFSGLHLTPQLAALRGDARFAELFPTDFSRPFVEDRVVIHDWSGEGAGQEFGWEARGVGDVDRDGIADAVVSAPANQPGGGGVGKVYVYSGRSGALLWSATGKPDERLGTGIEAAGDVDGDGTPDVVAGAPGGGRVYVYAGATGAVLLTLPAAADDGTSFGDSVSGAGDLDGDGRGDVMVGSSTSREGAGRVYVFSGKSGAVLRQYDGDKTGEALGSAVAAGPIAVAAAASARGAGSQGTLLVIGAPNAGPRSTGRVYVYDSIAAGAPAKFTIDADRSGRQLGGMFVSVIGDVDADGTADVYASDWADAGQGSGTGRIYVHSGRDGSRILSISGDRAGEGFGIGPARAGDVDGDGHADLVVGAWQHGSAAHSGGKIVVLSGKDGSTLATWTGRIPGETLGFDADGMGDVDGDGSADFLVTSAWSLIKGVRSGRVMIVSGRLR